MERQGGRYDEMKNEYLKKNKRQQDDSQAVEAKKVKTKKIVTKRQEVKGRWRDFDFYIFLMCKNVKMGGVC